MYDTRARGTGTIIFFKCMTHGGGGTGIIKLFKCMTRGPGGHGQLNIFQMCDTRDRGHRHDNIFQMYDTRGRGHTNQNVFQMYHSLGCGGTGTRIFGKYTMLVRESYCCSVCFVSVSSTLSSCSGVPVHSTCVQGCALCDRRWTYSGFVGSCSGVAHSKLSVCIRHREIRDG